jgi:hypothetical protein
MLTHIHTHRALHRGWLQVGPSAAAAAPASEEAGPSGAVPLQSLRLGVRYNSSTFSAGAVGNPMQSMLHSAWVVSVGGCVWLGLGPGGGRGGYGNFNRGTGRFAE